MAWNHHDPDRISKGYVINILFYADMILLKIFIYFGEKSYGHICGVIYHIEHNTFGQYNFLLNFTVSISQRLFKINEKILEIKTALAVKPPKMGVTF